MDKEHADRDEMMDSDDSGAEDLGPASGSDTSSIGGEGVQEGAEEAPPEFYDPEADDKEEARMTRLRQGRASDAILSCPGCFTTLCIECQQHDRYDDQFRAMLVMNCRVRTDQVVKHGPGPRRKRKAKQRQQAAEQQAAEQQATEQQQREQGQGGALASTQAQYAEDAEALNPVSCAVCGEDVALRGVADGVYHFFNVVASVS